MPWSVTLTSTWSSPQRRAETTTRVFSGLYATALSTRFRRALTRSSWSPCTRRPSSPPAASSISLADALVRQPSSASATTSSTETERRSGSGSSPWTRDSVIRSWTRFVSRTDSYCIRPANRRTASGSSAAFSTVSASSHSAPTGVLSSWLTFATKSRRIASVRCMSVRSSASTRTRPCEPSGVTRTANQRPSARLRAAVEPTWISVSRISPSRRTSRAIASTSSTTRRSPLTRP